MKYPVLVLSLIILVSCQDENSTSQNVEKTVELNDVVPTENDVIKVFKASGDKQCQSSNSSLDMMSSELVSSGVDVICAFKGRATNTDLTSCGSVTGEINVFDINNSNLPDALVIGYKKISTLNMGIAYLEKCAINAIPKPVENIKVYKRDIQAQCQGEPMTPKLMAEQLISQGIIVRCAQKNTDGLVHAAVCGGTSGNINVFTINKNDAAQAILSGFNNVTELTNYTDSKCEPVYKKVYKDYQYSQCIGSPIAPQDMAQDLIAAGIVVKCSQRGSTGKLYAAVCNGLSGGRNIFEINSSDVTKATLNGFRPVSDLVNYTDVVCTAN
ncbi:hypothetical protein MNBD_GAMMA22-1059 [hydrothermal vent metagenome]|uniref:Lipoprotein n=1 Tax=hydrothermal vent metagenome TaxID=652676 RepID=A0A3B1AKM7_9ZZZZ